MAKHVIAGKHHVSFYGRVIMSDFVEIGKDFSPVMPMVLVGTATNGKANFMAAAWCVRVNYEPPMIGVSIGKGKITSEAILANREFSICIPNVDKMAETDYCGTVAGVPSHPWDATLN